jgi:RimJ/RimL family protein N-acetyltransferase
VEVDPQKVVLRQLSLNDVSEKYIGWLNDPEVYQFMGLRHKIPVAQQDVIRYIETCNKNKRHHWGIFNDGEHVGNVTCGYYERNYHWADISNIIGEKKFRGTNLAKFALVGAIDYLFNIAGLHRLQAITLPVNFAGIALLANIGMRKEAVFKKATIVDDVYVDVLVYGILKEEWLKRNYKIPSVKVIRPFWE